MKTLAVINEHAGGGAMADIFRRLEHRLEDAIGRFDVVFTDAPGHATSLVQKALRDGYRRILAGGGDGTLSECANGFLADGVPIAPDAELAILSGGTGGDFRKTVGVRSTDEALAALIKGKTIAADVGRVTYTLPGGQESRCFINVAGFGMAGVVDRNVAKLKQLPGKVAYYGATLMGLWGWKNPRVVLTLDGEPMPEQPIFSVAVAKGRYIGGGMYIAPDARLDSGVFEVAVLGNFGRAEIMLRSRAFYDGTHVYHPKVQMRRAKVVEAVSTEPGREVLLDIDGEAIGTLPARFEILPAVLKLVVP